MDTSLIRDKISSTAIPLRGDDIDTDRIIPARYLRCVTFDGLGDYAFYDERFSGSGEKDHVFNSPEYKGAAILLVNKNFGCGSSREHAPQSLMRYGINAFVGESFSEIFFGNCVALGLPAVTVSQNAIEVLQKAVEVNPKTIIYIDLKEQLVHCNNSAFTLTIPESARRAFLEGIWDSTQLLLNNSLAIASLESALPY